MSAVIEKPNRAKVLAKVTDRLTGSLGGSIDEFWRLRESKRTAEAAVKVIDDQIAAQETLLFERLEKDGLRKADGKNASVSITEAVVANVTDWDSFYAYVGKHKHFHLLQKRVSDPAWRELMEKSKGKGVPGTEPFTKKKLNLRSLASSIV